MDVKVYKLIIESPGYTAQDVTSYVADIVSKSGIKKGIAVVYAYDVNCMVVEIEYEPDLLADLEQFLKNIGCLDEGLCEVVLGKSVVVPIINGSMFLGRFKNIVFVDVSRVKGSKDLVVVLEGVFKDS